MMARKSQDIVYGMWKIKVIGPKSHMRGKTKLAGLTTLAQEMVSAKFYNNKTNR